MTQILAERYRAAGIDVIAFDPGPVKTDLARNLSFPMRVVFGVASLFMPRTSKAAAYATTSVDINGKTGQLVTGTKTRPLNFEADYRARLWDATVQALPFELSSHAPS